MADNNIIIKITSEANLDDAQKQLKALTQRAKEQEEQMYSLRDAEKADAALLKQQITDREKLSERLRDNSKYYRQQRNYLKEDIQATKQSIKSINEQIKGYKLLKGESGRMVQQLRAMREELQRMEDSGEFGTKAFMDLAIAAGQLEDQIGDTQQRIRILSSDTIGLDTAMGISDGLAGAFYVATSAAEVFGSDMEGLQQAFYKVQAAMSTLSGVQQIATALNKDNVVSVVLGTKMENLRQKALARSAAAEAAYNTQKAAGVGISKLWTAAQWKLNAAIAANPIGAIVGIILAAVAAAALLVAGIGSLVKLFSAAGKAQRAYQKDLKQLEKTLQDVAIMNDYYAQKIENKVKRVNDAQRKETNEAKKRNASDLEMLTLEKKYADERAKIYEETIPQALKKQKQAVLDSKKVLQDAQDVVNNTKGEKKRKKALEQLKEAQDKYNQAQDEYNSLAQQQSDAVQEAADAEIAIQDKLREYRNQAQQANIDLMREGAAKEIAQINLNYKEQLKAVQGNSAEEIALRKALLQKQAKEIADVRKKYALEAQQTAIQEQKNLLTLMSQAGGTEEDYQDQIKLTKEIAEAEAQAKIDALDKTAMSKKAYAAEVKAIELELANTIREIDEQEVQRANENAKRKTEIALMEAEAATRTLNGAESAEYQKKVWENYYDERAKQIEENETHEIEAINRSTATTEEKEAQITLIQKNAQKEREDLKKEEAGKFSEIDAQYLDELQRNVEKAERDVEKAQGGAKLQALKDRFEAEQALYAEQQEQLKAQYDAGLIQEQEYENQRWEIIKATEDSIAAYREDKMQTVLDGFNLALDTMQQVSDMVFGAIQDNIQAEMDALDEMYTTDAEEAKENANKKYISEKELADKKAALELKAAKYAKTQALINAAINTASAIVMTLAQLGATPWGIAASVIAGAMGAAQIGIIASKPLAQYAKGRKGGQGEYALVGEKGAEIMYIPAGASIIPNHKINDMSAWGDYGVPTLPIPASANINQDVLNQAVVAQGMVIDYDRLGKAVAAAMPKQKQVSVNVDRNGITVQQGHDTRTYLNTKYTGAWS